MCGCLRCQAATAPAKLLQRMGSSFFRCAAAPVLSTASMGWLAPWQLCRLDIAPPGCTGRCALLPLCCRSLRLDLENQMIIVASMAGAPLFLATGMRAARRARHGQQRTLQTTPEACCCANAPCLHWLAPPALTGPSLPI